MLMVLFVQFPTLELREKKGRFPLYKAFSSTVLNIMMRFLLVAADKSTKIPIEVPTEIVKKSTKISSKLSKLKTIKSDKKAKRKIKSNKKVRQIARSIAK